MIKLMHFADTHVGMENYGKDDRETGLNTRLFDFQRSLNAAVDHALSEGVDLAIFSGDAYKTRQPLPTHQRIFVTAIKRIIDRGVPVVILLGNHDLPNVRGKAHAVHIFPDLEIRGAIVADKPELYTIDTKSGKVQVACLPFLRESNLMAKDKYKGRDIQKEIERIYGDQIKALSERLEGGIPSVLTAHLTVTGAELGSERNIIMGREATVPVSTLTDTRFDYVALGHIHRFQDLNRGRHPPVVYCGSIERIDFGEERERKGYCLVRLDVGRAEYEHIPIPARRFVTINVSPKRSDPTREIVSSVRRREIEGAVVRVRCTLSSEQRGLVREGEVRRALKDAHYVAGLSFEVTDRSHRSRNRNLNEKLSPVDALREYIKVKALDDKAEKMLEYAERLLAEIESPSSGEG
ncbi:MAG: metallophosphoesterase family protein [bacterium]